VSKLVESPMRNVFLTGRWIVSGGALLALSGCFTTQQLVDFGRTEVARTISDFVGQVFQLLVLART